MPHNSEPISINQKFLGLASEYELVIDCLYVDQDAIRVKYKIFPPLVPNPEELGFQSPIPWSGEGKDNSGNEYHSMGGGCGLSLDGQYSDGTLSFLPFPSPETTWLEITMFSGLITPEYKCTFTVFLRGFE